MPSRELDEAKRLLTRSIGDRATAEDRKAFHRQVIRLCSINDMDSKAYFGSMVWKHFKEFDDLQDSAVDAILDLCEDDDEKTRIQGIKGLKTTAKADPRWVKSNTGVLLQLLGSASPNELGQVHLGLCELFMVAPVDAIRAMIDECLDSEDGEGSSRRNTLNFLVNNAAPQRKEVFESGNNRKAEEALKSGLHKVLKKKLSSTDTLTILRLLMSLSTVSGRNATKDDAGDFADLMVESIPYNASRGAKEDLVRLFGEYVDKNPPLDPREALKSVKQLSDTLTAMALERGDSMAKKVVDRLDTWAEESIDLWARDRTDEFPKEKIVSGYCKFMITDILGVVTPTSFKLTQSASLSLEKMLFSIYSLQSWRDSRSDVVKSKDVKDLKEVSRYSSDLVKRAKGPDIESLRNIETISEWLTKTTSTIPKITPSWKREASNSRPRPVSPVRPTSPPAARQPPPKTRPVIQPRPPIVPPQEASIPRSPNRAGPSSSAELPPAAPAPAPPIITGNDQAPTSTTAPQSGARGVASQATRQHVKVGQIIQNEKLPLSKRFSKEPTASPVPAIGNAITPSAPAPSSSGTPAKQQLTIAGRNGGVELLPTPSPQSRAGQELLPHLLTQPDDSAPLVQSTQAGPSKPALTPQSSTPSLAARLGIAQNSGKRSRDASPQHPEAVQVQHPPGPSRSLLDRMNSREDPRSIKRPKSNTDISKGSLADRIRQNTAGLPSTPPVIDAAKAAAPTPGRSLSIRNTAVEQAGPGPKTMSIFGRGSQPTPTPTPKATTDGSYFHIGNGNGPNAGAPPSATATRPVGLSIRAASQAAKKEDEPVRRKGRGFKEQDGDGDWEMPMTSSILTSNSSVGLPVTLAGRPLNIRRSTGSNGNVTGGKGPENGNGLRNGQQKAPASLASRLS